jgi:uncharacterized protein (DUF1015 family)
MAIIEPFQCVRPNQNVVSKVAALPYDVYNRTEAMDEVKKEPLSFLKIDRAETNFDEEVDTYDSKVYLKAKEIFKNYIDEGIFISDKKDCYYVYELIMKGRAQTGIVACASIDDYTNNIIKKHENTREDKEIDRINHVDVVNAQTGPIFLAYRSNEIINKIVNETKKEKALYSFVAVDAVGHNVWKIEEDKKVSALKESFAVIGDIYIADGHHRAASAVKVGIKRRKENPGYTGEEGFNFFLSVLFPHDQLMIMDYNRTVKDLNGNTKEEFLTKVRENFEVVSYKEKQFHPMEKGTFGMYLEKTWYQLKAKPCLKEITDVVESLDVSLLQEYLLIPILGIKDPRVDKRIDFIGGIRGLDELERRANSDMMVSFAMYPTSILELFAVADEGRLMPPKSTWFEPKLRSGLFIHKL